MDNNLRDKRLNYGMPLNPGQIGCALSHIKIWEEAYEKGYENILIFEDDAIKSTTNFEHIKRHYFYSHENINPFRIIPIGPEASIS